MSSGITSSNGMGRGGGPLSQPKQRFTTTTTMTTSKLETDSMVGAGIQLNDRQLKMLEARRKSKGGASVSLNKAPTAKGGKVDMNSMYNNLKKLANNSNDKSSMLQNNKKLHATAPGAVSHDSSDYWAVQQTETGETAPMTTWSESGSEAGASEAHGSAVSSRSHAASSAANSRQSMKSTVSSYYSGMGNEAADFYGQRLSGKDKKLYDDTGATWSDDSASEVASLSSSVAASTAKSGVSNTSSHRFKLQKQTSTVGVDENRSEVSSGSKSLSLSVAGSSSDAAAPSITLSTHSSRQHSFVADDEVRDESAVRKTDSVESIEPLHSRSGNFEEGEQHVPPSLVNDTHVPHQEATKMEDEVVKNQRHNKLRMRLNMKRQQQQEEKVALKDQQHERTKHAGATPHKDLLNRLLSSGMNQISSAASSSQRPSNKDRDSRDDGEQNTSDDTRTKRHHFGGLSLRKMGLGGSKPPKSTISGGSGSSISQKDKAIMRSVLARSQNQMSKGREPSSPKKGLLRSTSARMKKILSSPKTSPRVMEESTETTSRSSTSSEKNDEDAVKTSKETGERPIADDAHDSVTDDMEQMHELSRPIDLSRVASRVMDELIENGSDDDKDQEDESDEEDDLSLHEAKPIRSFASVIRNDEIEVKISATGVDPSKNLSGTDDHQGHSDAIRARQKSSQGVDATTTQTQQLRSDKYDDFVNVLKADLAESHSQMYEGFNAMFHESGADVQPPKPLSVFPASLDLKAKETLAAMDSHLKNMSDDNCVLGSQMTSDKELRMSPRPGEIGFGQHLLHRNKDVSTAFFSAEKIQPVSREGRKNVFKSNKPTSPPAIVQNDSMDTISAGPEGTEFEVTLTQHVRKSTAGPKKPPQHISKPTGPINSKSNTRINSTKQAGKYPPLPTPSPKESIEWTDIKLRSVSGMNSGEESSNKIPASWTKVKLRPVVQKPAIGTHSDPIVTESDAESTESESFHRIVLKKKYGHEAPEIEQVPSSISDITGTDNKPIDVASTAMSGTDEKPIEVASTVISGTDDKPIEVASTVISGTDEKPILLSESMDVADLARQPLRNVQPVDLNEGSIMVALSKEDGEKSGKEMKLIIGRDGMMKVAAVPGDSKVQVVWRLLPDDIQSVLLDTSTNSVKLMVSSPNKKNRDLSFSTSEQCMKFVNALHEMTNSESAQCDPITANHEADNASLYVEQLSEEEQKVLEEFRLRKSQPVPRPPPAPPSEPQDQGTNQDFRKQLLALTGGLASGKPFSVVDTKEMAPPSPLSEVSGANQIALSANEKKTAESYQKMLKMKIPRGAVQQKMIMNGVSSKVMDYVLSGNETNSSKNEHRPPALVNNLSEKDEETAEKYRKMMKIGMPEGAVRHKMQKDGVDSKIVAAVLGDANANGYTANVSSPVNVQLNVAEQAIAETYRRMLKTGVPKEAVEHRMKKDGIAQKIILSLLGKTEAGNSAKTSQSTSLTPEEETIASRYRKLLKLNIPREELRFRMKQEGIAEKIITTVLGNAQNKKNQQATRKRGFNQQGFHWTEIDDESIAGSVWSKAKPMSETGAEKPEEIIDITKHIEMFQKKPDDDDAKKSTKKVSTEPKKDMAKLIDVNRANNVAITLKAFKDLSMKDLAKVIEFLDPSGKVKGDRALFMKDLLPTISEAKAVKDYKGSDDRLIIAEKWFREIVHIKRIEDKISVMRTMETFKTDTVITGKSFQLLTKVCNQVMDSDRLPDLLEMVREIGNRMNEGRGEAAAGFKLDFLPRLIQTKGTDKKTTALDLVVMIFMTRNNREALDLSADFPDCQEASRISISDLMADVRDLEGSIRMTKKELDHLRKELESSVTGKPPRKRGLLDPESRSDTAVEKPLSTFPFSRDDGIQSEVSGGGSSVMPGSKSPRASLMAAVKYKEESNDEFTIEASIRRLEKFVSEAEYVHLARLKQDHDSAVEACKSLASFFCESGGEKVASKLLRILDEFATHVDQAVKKYDFQQEADARRKASEERKAASEKAPPAPETPSKDRARAVARPAKKGPPNPERATKNISQNTSEIDTDKKSLVVMVNEMLKRAGDEQVKDFVEGRVVENPDDYLQRIYHAEQERMAGYADSTTQRDILSAIKQRRGKARESNAHQGLADLRAKLANSPGNKASGTGCRRSSIADRWSSTARKETTSDDDEDDDVKFSNKTGQQNSGVAERWAKKAPDSPIQSSKNSDVGKDDLYEKTDSEILASSSHDTEDFAYQQKRRQSYINRWTAKTPSSVATDRDIDEESDVGEFEEKASRTKQRYASRWARNPASSEELIEE